MGQIYQPIERCATIVTPRDESYAHQLVAPAHITQHVDVNWAERCYHLLHLGGPTILQTGRALHAHAGRRTGFAGLSTGKTQHALRIAETFSLGDDPDVPQIGPLRIEATRPLQEIRLVLEAPAGPLAFDLTYTARFPPVATTPNRIEREGTVVTEYMNLFQSGSYSGTVVVDGTVHEVVERTGFRDRGWGLRKHEGAPRRGLVVAAFCELPDAALYLILYETASGRRVFTNGWLINTRGAVDTVTSAAHQLAWAAGLLVGGTIDIDFASGARRKLEFDVLGRLYLSVVGYTADEERKLPGAEVYDVSRPEVVAELDGQNDNACSFRCDGVQGHGYVETGLGIHARYRPDR